MNTQVWSDFLQQNWLVIVIALIVLFVVLNLVKTMVKWALVVIIVIGLIVYSGISLDQINKVVTTVKDETVDTVKNEAMKVMTKEVKDAEYEAKDNRRFTISTPNLQMSGEIGSDTVNVTFRGVPIGEWKVNDTIKTFISESKNNTNSASGK